MSTISTYQLDEPVSFRMKRMEDIYRLAEGKADHPHRHDYYTIIVVEQAGGEHVVDFQSYALGPRQLYFVSPHQVHQLAATSEPQGWALTFSTEFLIRNGIREAFISDINLFADYGQAPPLELDEVAFAKVIELVSAMQSDYQQQGPFRYEAVGAWLKLMLITCNTYCTLPDDHHPQQAEAAAGLLRRFKDLVDQYFRQQHKVGAYAEQLMVSSDHLNRTIKSLTGRTAKEYIQSRITVEAKRLLLFSQQSAKELAYELGFDTPSHFSNFFKKCTGYSPTAWREELGRG